MKKLIFVGAGGHAASVLEVVESAGIYSVEGFVDEKCNDFYDIPWLGSDEDLPRLIDEFMNVVVTIGSIKSPVIRKKAFLKLNDYGAVLPVISASTSVISKHAKIGAGTVLFHHSLVNGGAEVGENCIINSGAIIEHDAVIGSHTHISTTACINGNAVVGMGCFIGSGSVVVQGVEIADNIVIGAGSLVRKSIVKPGVYAGNPLRKINEQ